MRTLPRSLTRAASAAVTLVAAAPAALAAEPNGEAAAWSPFQGDFGNFLWTVLIFAVVVWVLRKFAWGPILGALQGRESYIRDSLEQAKSQREAAEARMAEYEKKLAEARGEVEAMLAEARRDAAALRERESEAAKQDAAEILERARREITLAKDDAVRDLYRQAANLATAAAGQVLQRELRPEDHERLIAESIEAMERQHGGAPSAAASRGAAGGPAAH
ncbi:MAG TPA: F0F1 ATP synthase subunit B [Thermoanaerobaculia bacterium]|nr:F0F1 ATP synthase subunit B [Thermoanaerobaculia bacterium]